MNNITTRQSAAITGIVIPEGARAVLVFEGDQGELLTQPVTRGKSVLNIETELLDHLDARPFDPAWLKTLADYCTQKIAALEDARGQGGFIMPSHRFEWTMTGGSAVQS